LLENGTQSFERVSRSLGKLSEVRMAENSAIEWTDHTFNPWIGCTKVSPACDKCYAAEMMDNRYGRAKWGAGEPRVRTAASNWKIPRKWNKQAG